jgi:hypothetical protein
MPVSRGVTGWRAVRAGKELRTRLLTGATDQTGITAINQTVETA